jgi:glycosyltransferase involved in cell wall biosynthesis
MVMDRMKPLGLFVVSKEAWGDTRWARKQWLPYFLSQGGAIDRVLYLDRHCAWWRREVPHAPLHTENIEVRQESLLLPLERCSRVRSWNRRRIASRVLPLLDPRHAWVSLFYHPFDVSMMRLLAGRSKVVFDWTEDWAVFHNDASMARLQRRAVEEADIVLTVTSVLREKAVSWRGNDAGVYHVPNATALEPPVFPVTEAESIRDIRYPRIGFVGHAGPWFDEQLVASLAERMPAWHWLMIGGCSAPAEQALSGRANVHWLGSKPPDQLMSYMQCCDVLVAPYKKGIEGDATKLYDYLVAGKPIISIACETAERLQPWVTICDDIDAWQHALDMALNNKDGHAASIPVDVIRSHHWRARAAVVAEILRGLVRG